VIYDKPALATTAASLHPSINWARSRSLALFGLASLATRKASVPAGYRRPAPAPADYGTICAVLFMSAVIIIINNNNTIVICEARNVSKLNLGRCKTFRALGAGKTGECRFIYR